MTDDAVRDDAQRPPCRQRQYLRFRRALKEVQTVERLGHGFSDRQHAVIGQQQNGLVAEDAGQPLALRSVERQTVVVGVVGHLVEEPDRTLVGHLQCRVLEHAQGGRIGHVRVQHTLDPPAARMNRRVNAKRRVLDGAAARIHRPVQADDQKVARLDLRPVQAEWREQEPVDMPGNQ